MNTEPTKKSVFQAINAVQMELAKIGITKDRRNAAQGYNFRGIDDVYNTISPLMAKYGLCVLPRMLSRECQERQTAKGGAMFYVVVAAEFDFVSADDASCHTVRTYGEAMDSGDKATNKAMSAAYKYAAFQTFAIPTEGDNDADAHSPEAGRAVTPSLPAFDAIGACLKINETSTLEELQKSFGESWGKADAVGKKILKTAYEKRKTILSKETGGLEQWQV